jgi:thiamine-phosphate pyrophosphorylase
MRRNFDLSFYFVIGPENTNGRDFGDIVRQAIAGGITFLQVRAKYADAREVMALAETAANEIKAAGKENAIALVIDDRVDAAQALRLAGVHVDGVHLGQSDIPVQYARRILGEDAIIGLSARAKDVFGYIKNFNDGANSNVGDVDYFGAGPIRATPTKPDCGLVDGVVLERTFDEIRELKRLSPLPVVVGGGVKLADIQPLKQTGVDGFFVVSAISQAQNPELAARELLVAWQSRS